MSAQPSPPGRARYPFVLGLVRVGGKECELVLRRDGSVGLVLPSSLRAVGSWSLHEAADWLREYRVASA